MTLALYGKSRRRQGSLLLAALIAVVVAMAAGVAGLQTALAHHSTHKIDANCNQGTWTYSASFFGGGTSGTPRKVEIYKNNSLVKTEVFNGKSDVANFYTETVPFGPNTNVTFRIEMYSGAGTDMNGEEPSDEKIQGTGPCKQINISNGECADSGFEFHFLIPNGVSNGSGGKLFITYKYDNGSPQSFPPVNEANNQSAPVDWRPIIPFNGHASITILGAYSESGGVWVGNGIDKATVNASDCVVAKPKITVIKRVVDHNGNDIEDPTDFSFKVEDGDNTANYNATFKLDDDSDGTLSNTKVLDNLPAVSGSSDWYEIKETNANDDGWALVSITCTGAVDLDDPDTDDGDIEVKVNNNSDVTCTFTNKKPKPPTKTLEVCKEVVGNNNGILEGGVFTITVTGQDDFKPNVDETDNPKCKTYEVAKDAEITIAETGLPAGWVHANSYPKIDVSPGTDPADGSMSVTVTMSSDRKVTFKNKKGEDPTGKIIVKKVVDPTPGTPPTNNENFSGKIDGTINWGPITFGGSTAPGAEVSVGNHTVSETSTEGGWVPYGWKVLASSTDQCPTEKAAYTPGASIANVAVEKDKTTVVCVMNTKAPLVVTPSITKVKHADGATPGGNAYWTIGINNTGSTVAQNVYIEDAGATFEEVLGGGTCSGDTDFGDGDGITCSVDAGATLEIKVSKPAPATACQPGSVNNGASFWVGTEADGEATGSAGNTDDTKYTIDGDRTKCDRDITVCKIVVGNGDGVQDGGQFVFGTSNTDSKVVITAVEPAADATDGTEGEKVCGSLTVKPGDQSVFEWSGDWRPGKNSLTGTWNGDAAGFPKAYAGATDSCSTLQGNGTVNITDQTTEVTFCNKTVPRIREITITKHFVNTGGYVPVAENDLPAFTLVPDTDTSCEAPVKVDDYTYTVTCTVPYDWAGEVQETPKAGWEQVACNGNTQQNLLSSLQGLLRSVASVVVAQSEFTFCNQPYANIVIIKDDQLDGAEGDLWDFTIGNATALNGAALTAGQADTGTVFTEQIRLNDLALSVSEDLDGGTIEECIGEDYYTIPVIPADVTPDTPGETITFTFTNLGCGIAGTGNLIIEKYEDINGNGIVDAGDDPIAAWSFVTNVPNVGNTNAQTNGDGQILDYFGFDIGTVLTVTETQQAGWKLTMVYLDGVQIGTNLTNAVVIPGNGQTKVLRYLNQPLGSIKVHKNAYTRHNLGPDVFAPNDVDGWKIRVSSVACGNLVFEKFTDANGDVTFDNLPMCNDWVVAEVGPNAGSPGFVQVAPAGAFTNQTPSGQTLTFVNRKDTADPPCLNCRQVTSTPTPTPTPVTPTATPTDPADPTATPTDPADPTATPTNTPVSIVEGEQTPGPGSTPIAPSAGSGLVGGTTGGLNLLLVLAGLLALSGGLGFLALGRKGNR